MRVSRADIKFWKSKYLELKSIISVSLTESRLLSLRWSSSSQILVFIMSTFSPLRNQLALNNQTTDQKVITPTFSDCAIHFIHKMINGNNLINQ